MATYDWSKCAELWEDFKAASETEAHAQKTFFDSIGSSVEGIAFETWKFAHERKLRLLRELEPFRVV